MPFPLPKVHVMCGSAYGTYFTFPHAPVLKFEVHIMCGSVHGTHVFLCESGCGCESVGYGSCCCCYTI